MQNYKVKPDDVTINMPVDKAKIIINPKTVTIIQGVKRNG